MEQRHDIPLRELVQRLAEMLHDMAGAGAAIEDSVGDQILSGQMDLQGLSQALQGLDHLMQMIAELGLFLERIGPELDAEQVLNIGSAARRMRLRDMSRQLLGLGKVLGRESEEPEASQSLPGEVDMF